CHHLFSQGELHSYVYLESLPQVFDIKEQFALDPERTQRLAEELNIRHPGSTQLRSITPITTDLFVGFRSHARTRWVAMARKPTNILAIASPKGRTLRAVNSL